MKTIIELYDREPIENLLSTIIFQPEHVVYITGCDAPDAIRRQAMERALSSWLRTQSVFLPFLKRCARPWLPGPTAYLILQAGAT